MTSEDQKILFEKLGKQMNYTLGLPNFKLMMLFINFVLNVRNINQWHLNFFLDAIM